MMQTSVPLFLTVMAFSRRSCHTPTRWPGRIATQGDLRRTTAHCRPSARATILYHRSAKRWREQPRQKLSAEERLQRYYLMLNQCICRVTEKPTPGKVDAIIPEAETSRYRPESTSQTGLDPEKPLPGTTVQRQSQRHGSEWSRSRTNRLIFKFDIFTGECLVTMLCRGSTAVLLRQGQANRLESVCKENIFLCGQLF